MSDQSKDQSKVQGQEQQREQEKEKSQADQLRDFFWQRLGSDWRREVSLTLRCDKLSWFVYLIEKGIEARLKEFKEDVDKGTMRRAEMAASVASWQMDLEELVKVIQDKFSTQKKQR